MNQLAVVGKFLSDSMTSFFDTLSQSWYGIALISLVILDIAVSVLIILRGTK